MKEADKKFILSRSEGILELQNQFSKDSQVKMYMEMLEKIALSSKMEATFINGDLKLSFPENVQYRINFFMEELQKIKEERYSLLFK